MQCRQCLDRRASPLLAVQQRHHPRVAAWAYHQGITMYIIRALHSTYYVHGLAPLLLHFSIPSLLYTQNTAPVTFASVFVLFLLLYLSHLLLFVSTHSLVYLVYFFCSAFAIVVN